MDLDAIEARANACLAGGWAIRENADYETEIVSAADDWCRIALLGGMPGETPAEAAFFVRAREDVRDLVTRVRELEDENQRMREYLSHATRFQIGAVEVYKGRFGGWVVCVDRERLDKAADRDAALSRAREIAEEEA